MRARMESMRAVAATGSIIGFWMLGFWGVGLREMVGM